MVIDLTQPEGKYAGLSEGILNILNIVGQVEKDRQERELTDTVLSGLSSGKDFDSILADVAAKSGSPYAKGPKGWVQRVAGAFAPRSSPTLDALSRLGLSYANPRTQAAAGTQQAREQLYSEQAETERQVRPGRVAGEVAKVGATAAQEAARRANEALSLQRAHGLAAQLPGEVATGQGRAELLGEQAETVRQMRPEQLEATKALTQSRQEQTAASRFSRGETPTPVTTERKVSRTDRMTGQGPVESISPIEGLEDVWDRLDDGERQELRRYDELYQSKWPDLRQDWLDKVRSMVP